MSRSFRLALVPIATAILGCGMSDRTATLIRDEWGVPHVFAAREDAGFYALGYAMAEDRLRRLLGFVRFARGELAAAYGPAFLESDATARRWRFREMAEAGVEQLGPELRRNYQAFLAGLQAFAAERPADSATAALVRGLTVADLIALTRAALYTGYQVPVSFAECRIDGIVYSSGYLPYQAAAAPGSNGWVVMPRRTAEGALLLAADPHVEVESIAYYEYHLEAGGLHSAGFALGPVLWQAHTEHAAWALTTGNPDFLDCYQVLTDPASPTRYRFDGAQREMEVRVDTIAVAGQAPVVRTFEYTRHNGVLSPVVARRGDTALVASTPDMERAGYLHREFDRMNRARSVAEVKAALATMSMFPQNVIVGDRDGEVLFVRAGRAPIRPTGWDWSGPVPGNDSSTAWRGVHALEDLVQVENPAAGFLQNDNVAPDVMAPGLGHLRTAPPDLFFDRPGRQTSRGARTVAVLGAVEPLTMERAMGLAFDELWITTPDWLAGLRYAVALRPGRVGAAPPAFRAALARLERFDGRAAAESPAALDFYFWRIAAAPRLARLADRSFIDYPWDSTRFTPAFADALLDGLRESLDHRQSTLGTTDQPLGDLMRVARGTHEAPVGGVTIYSDVAPHCLELLRAVCEAPMRAFIMAPIDSTRRQRAAYGSQAMRIVQFTNPIQAFSLYAFGQSDDTTSAHFADQLPLFSEKRMKRAWFSRAEVEPRATVTRVLTLPDPNSR
ncbi:MAG: penicillin acylase family protein [Gemmatimonadales bacterium]